MMIIIVTTAATTTTTTSTTTAAATTTTNDNDHNVMIIRCDPPSTDPSWPCGLSWASVRSCRRTAAQPADAQKGG